MAARLDFEERKFILKYYWKYENAVEVQRQFRSLTKNHQHELLSLELEISLKLMELLRTSIRSIPEDHVHRQALERKKEYWKPLKEVQESLCGKLVVR